MAPELTEPRQPDWTGDRDRDGDVDGAAPGPVARTWWPTVALLLALVPVATHLVDLLLTDRRWWPQVFEDDTYYYLGVARSIAEGHGSTFTGLVPTNGYHPLWLLLLVPVSLVARTPYQVVVAVTLVQALLWLGVVREALRIGRRIGPEATAIAGVTVLGVLAVVTGRLSFNGMESAPLLLLLVLAVRLALDAGDDDDPGTDLRFGVVLALICLTRLDAVVTAVPLAGVMLFRGGAGRGTDLRRLAGRALRLGGPAGLGLGTYVVINLAVFGTALPVSGRAKGLGGPFLNLEPARQFLRAGDALGRPVWFGTMALLMVAGAWLCGQWRASRVGRRLMACTLAFVVGQLVLLAYLVFGTSYRVWPWYHYNVALFAFGAALLLAEWLRPRLSVAVVNGAVLAAAALVLVAQAAAVRLEETPYAQSVRAADFVEEHLPGDAVLAMGDRAGIFGYLADRPLLHLEGLMADAAYLDDLESGTALRRMQAEGVDYYVTYGPRGRRVEGGADGAGGSRCWRFEEPYQGDGPRFPVIVCDEDVVFRSGRDDDELTIWRFRPPTA